MVGETGCEGTERDGVRDVGAVYAEVRGAGDAASVDDSGGESGDDDMGDVERWGGCERGAEDDVGGTASTSGTAHSSPAGLGLSGYSPWGRVRDTG